MKVKVSGKIASITKLNSGAYKALVVTDNADVINVFTKKEDLANKMRSALDMPLDFELNINVEGIPTAFHLDIIN